MLRFPDLAVSSESGPRPDVGAHRRLGGRGVSPHDGDDHRRRICQRRSRGRRQALREVDDRRVTRLQRRHQSSRYRPLSARLRSREPGSPGADRGRHRVRCRSVSKQFTAFSILLLAQRKQLSLDHDVGKDIPGWAKREHTVTVRHLVSHTSGGHDASCCRASRRY